MRFLKFILFLPLLAACQEGHNTPASYDSWSGRWQGPEGTYLDLQKSNIADEYNLVIANLDGPRSFKAYSTPDGIKFEREGITEVLKSGNGQATGMKWLADKQNCLIIKAGEGYCRD